MNYQKDFIESIALPGERWKDIVGYEGLYIVSDLGRVASVPRIVPRRRNGKITSYPIHGGLKRTFLRGRKLPKYLYVDLYSQLKEFESKIVSRVVAEAFIPNPDKKPCVDHIDGNPLNNAVSNLRWCTHKENSHNPITITRTRQAKAYSILKIKDDVVVETFSSMRDAVLAGYNDCRIRICFKNPQYTHKGFHWIREPKNISLVSMSKNSSTPGIDYPQ